MDHSLLNAYLSRPAQPACFLRTTLPLGLSSLELFDSGRYHSIFIPDHMVSFWPDSIWTPEFTDLATVSPSPHRHLDAMAVAGAVAVLTKKVKLMTCVVDTVRRHPAMLAQTALTIDHLARGRFILGLGSGETENTVPYGFDFEKPVGRFEEALKVIRLLWESDGPVDFAGQYYQLHHARMDTEPFEGKFPKIVGAGSGPRMMNVVGRYCDGWLPGSIESPEDYAAKLTIVRNAAEQAGRDPMALMTPFISVALIAYDDAELARILDAPIVKSLVMQIPAKAMRRAGYAHPLGDEWRGIQDITSEALPRERILSMIEKFNPEALLAVVTHGTPQKVARAFKAYIEAGARVPKIMDYSGMAGLEYAAVSAKKLLETEDEFVRLERA